MLVVGEDYSEFLICIDPPPPGLPPLCEEEEKRGGGGDTSVARGIFLGAKKRSGGGEGA